MYAASPAARNTEQAKITKWNSDQYWEFETKPGAVYTEEAITTSLYPNNLQNNTEVYHRYMNYAPFLADSSLNSYEADFRQSLI